MKNKIDELRDLAATLLASDESNDDAQKQWKDNVRDLLQELSIYHFELVHQNMALEESEHNLLEARAKYNELFDEAPVGYVVIDREKSIKQVNRTFNEMVVPSYPVPGSVLDCKFDDLVCPEYQKEFQRFFTLLTNTRSIQYSEIMIQVRFGRPKFVAITAGKRKLEDNQFRLVITNINTYRRITQDSLSAKEEEKEHGRRKSLLLTNISHELRTPLATMAGFCEMLKESIPDSKICEKYLHPIQNAVQTLIQLTDDIQDFSLLQSGTLPLRNIDVDVVSICREQTMIAQHSIHEKEVVIHCELSNIPILSGDPLRLGTLLNFILRHATSNLSQGEIRLTGHYLPSENGMGMLVLEVAGNHIFHEGRMDDKITDESEVLGNCDGIGPFLASQVLNIMKGHFTRTSNLLHLEIPFCMGQKPTAPQPTRTEPTTGQGPKTCLLVDDVTMNLKVLAALMRKINYIPILAASGKEALGHLSSSHIDLIMTDLWMPEMNGMEFAMNVRQLSQYDHIPIVAVTADVEQDKNFDMRYFTDTLIKPVSLAVLQKRIVSMGKNSAKEGAK